jgi:hypothetical protein
MKIEGDVDELAKSWGCFTDEDVALLRSFVTGDGNFDGACVFSADEDSDIGVSMWADPNELTVIVAGGDINIKASWDEVFDVYFGDRGCFERSEWIAMSNKLKEIAARMDAESTKWL